MKKLCFLLFTSCALQLGAASLAGRDPQAPRMDTVRIAELPQEARATLALIKKSGPFAYDRDGATFNNFERRLPVRERGYYKEYTVPTPGTRGRGARRIVAGAGNEFYYTDDHYPSFRRILE